MSRSTRWQTVRLKAALLVAALAVAFMLPLHAQGRSFLWKATGPKGGTIFLAGSLHLLTGDYYPLAPAFETSFSQSDLLVEELDMAEMTAPASQMLMLQRGMMPSGQALESVLTPSTLEAVKQKVAAMGLPLGPLQLFKPWALALTLQGMEWQKAGYDADLGLDKHFYDAAIAKGTPVQGLETLAFEIGQFDTLPMPVQDRLLAESIKEMETEQTSVTELARAWKAGDAAGIEKLVLQDLRQEPEVYNRLLLSRNQNWLPKIEALFARPRPAFVVVGAAHLVGKDGLLTMLRAKGYTVTQQ